MKANTMYSHGKNHSRHEAVYMTSIMTLLLTANLLVWDLYMRTMEVEFSYKPNSIPVT